MTRALIADDRALFREALCKVLDAYVPGEPQDNPNTPLSKLGPIAAWQFLQSSGGLAQRGTLLLPAQWYLAHRFRTGGTVSGAIPFLGIGLVFSGDVKPGR